MADRPPPPIEATARAPRGAPKYARFGGILEGRRTAGDAEELERLARQLDRLGLAAADLELDGGRFTLMLADEPLPPARWSEADHERFVELLQQLVDAAADPRGVESTLRCTEVYEEDVVETLFAVVNGELKPVSRVRPAQPADRLGPAPGEEPALPAAGTRQALVLGALVLAVFAILAWRGGWIDRAFRAELAGAPVERGPFGELLAAEVSTRWGDYELALERGPTYPATTAELEALLAGAPTPADRAAINAVGDGGAIWAQLLDDEGEVLQAVELSLRPLLTDAGAVVEATLSGRMDARGIRLSLDAGKKRE